MCRNFVMKNPLVLTIDYGTQSVRVSLFDKTGKHIAMEKEVYKPPYFSLKPGYAEQNPELYYDSFITCAKRLCEKNQNELKSIIAITQTCFRDSAVLLDKDLKVIRPMVLWLDQRFAECKKPLPLKSRFLFSLVGMKNVIDMNRKRTISNWLIENEPENWAKVDKYVPVSSYFIYRMTGRLADASASVTGHYPMDFKKRNWYSNVEKHMQGMIFSLKQSQLCEIVPEGEQIGLISENCSKESGIPAGLPVYACGSDKSCETLGNGVIDSKKAVISLGTACTIETTISKYKKHDTFFPAYPFCIPGYYNLDVQVYRGFWMLNWFFKEFGAKKINDLIIDEVKADEFNQHLSEVPPGSDGLILQPYWGSLLERPNVKGAVIGFTDVTTRMHFYRAIIEGIFYCLREAGEHFEKLLKTNFEEIRVSGGGSVSPEICQICADIFGKKVFRPQTIETSSLGAAIAAFLAAKVYSSPEEATKAMVHMKDVYEPNLKNHEIYNKYFYDVYKHMYPSLKKSYKTLWDYTKR